MLLFSKSNKMFVGYCDPEKYIFSIMKINNYQGDLTDISAKKEALSVTTIRTALSIVNIQ